MKLIITCVLLIINSPAFSQYRPPSVSFNEGEKLVTFVDFQKAHYRIIYDVHKKKAEVTSKIQFKQFEKGFPVIDLVPKAKNLKAVKLPGAGRVKHLTTSLEPGLHSVIIRHELKLFTKFRQGTARSAFWTVDRLGRFFLERYLPSNLEFDQYPISLEIIIRGAEKDQEIFTNGEVKRIAENHFKITTPEYFNTSSFFFHLTQKNVFKKKKIYFHSIDGRVIPIVIYGKKQLDEFQKVTVKTLKKLEKDYGPWPHPKLVIFRVPFGGMEYAGATYSNLNALPHELLHSYFGRGTMPANGNAGWFDEAIARWADDGYPVYFREDLKPRQLASYSPYRRKTDWSSYKWGARFLGYLDNKLKVQGGMRAFLKEWINKYKHKIYTNDDIVLEINNFFNTDVSPDFDRYITDSKMQSRY